MEINQEDATVTHEATVGKIGDEQIFYLMTRDSNLKWELFNSILYAGIAPSLLAAIFTISGSMQHLYTLCIKWSMFAVNHFYIYASDSFFNEDISDIKSESSFASIVCDMSSHVTSLQSRPFLILSVGLIPRHIPWGALW